jgi:hypothetical protein
LFDTDISIQKVPLFCSFHFLLFLGATAAAATAAAAGLMVVVIDHGCSVL